MAIAESILPEFDHETATTRTLLERVPEDKAEWKPHVKSMALGQLAMHIANIPQWTAITLERTEFDTNPPGWSACNEPTVPVRVRPFCKPTMPTSARRARCSRARQTPNSWFSGR